MRQVTNALEKGETKKIYCVLPKYKWITPKCIESLT